MLQGEKGLTGKICVGDTINDKIIVPCKTPTSPEVKNSSIEVARM
jgi:hypothetical protein